MNMHSDGAGSINEALCDTIAAVFPSVCTVDVTYSTNRELFAAAFDVRQALTENLSGVSDPELRNRMGGVLNRLIPYSGGRHVLTDDKAPVELLGMRVIDGLIAGELGYYKEIFREQGVSGLLNAA